MKRNRVGWRILVPALGLFLLVGCGERKPEGATIGAVLPMTGNSAQYGVQMKEGIDLAVEEINEHGGVRGKPLTVMVEDGQADAKTSLAAFRKLASVNEVPAVLSGFSNVVLALAPAATKEKVLLLNCGATSPEIEGSSPYVFSDIPNAKQEATFLAEAVFKRFGYTKVAVFWQNNDAGLGMRNVFEKKFKELGGQIVFDGSHAANASDFRDQLIKLKASNPQAVFMPTYSKQFGLAMRQARELGINCQFFGYAATEVDETINLAKKAANGVIYSYYAYDQRDPTPATKRFLEAFHSKYGHDPNLYSATFYDGVYLVAAAMEDGRNSGSGIREYFQSMGPYVGASGKIDFTKTGAVIANLRLKTIKDGKFVELGPPGETHSP